MSRRTYGILAGLIGAGAWLWSRNRGSSAATNAVRERGTVIFHNTPEPAPLPSEGIL